jgi:hypothetical protein
MIYDLGLSCIHDLMRQAPAYRLTLDQPQALIKAIELFPLRNGVKDLYGEIMSYRSSLSTRMDGCCSNRVDIARIDDKIIEIKSLRFRYIVKLNIV